MILRVIFSVVVGLTSCVSMANVNKHSIEHYFHDTCSKTQTDLVVVFGQAISKDYSVCKDNTISFSQPDSEKLFNWEGKCGEVAVANTLKMTCGKSWLVDGVIDDATSDLSPGSMPSTLERTLNDFGGASNCYEKKWSYFNVSNTRKKFIASVLEGLRAPSKLHRSRSDKTKIMRAPVPVLIVLPITKELHWVTVVDIENFNPKLALSQNNQCQVFINQYGLQYKIPCYEFSRMAEEVENSSLGFGNYFTGRFVRIKQIR